MKMSKSKMTSMEVGRQWKCNYFCICFGLGHKILCSFCHSYCNLSSLNKHPIGKILLPTVDMQENPTGMATVYRLITKIRQKRGDRNQTFCTLPPGESVEFATNRI
jgi:hypothetical protein